MARKRKDCEEDITIPEKNRPLQRNAANARERARMRVLSKAFSRLKTSLPWVPADTKLSKLDTLRLASSYIAHLRQILTEDSGPRRVVHPFTLTWPFAFNSRSSPSGHEEQKSYAPKAPTTEIRYNVSPEYPQVTSEYMDFNMGSCNYNNNSIFSEMQCVRTDLTMQFS
ncbi:transcription factor 21-like [Tachypleus tridentatus]|uniref:transcription factor 21-like n=1 Tax=Tachypleus tridentatus TaxID=6853 RepID=UPI003FCF3188